MAPLTRRSLLSLSLMAAWPAWGSAAASVIARLNQLADRYQLALATFDPMAATLSGDHRFDDRLGLPIAPAQRTRHHGRLRALLAELARLPRAGLADADALNAELLEVELHRRLALAPFPDHLLPLQHMDALPADLANFASGQSVQPLQTVAHHRAFLRRLAGLPAWLAHAEANLREGQRRGVMHARSVIEAMLPQLRELAEPALANTPFAAPRRGALAGFGAAERRELDAAYAELVGRRIVPAMQRLVRFVEREHLPATRSGAAGWGSQPHGAAWYRALVRAQTTTDLSPEAIHRIGLDEVARLRAALEALRQPLQAPLEVPLLAWARQQARFKPFRSEAEVLAHYEGLQARVQPQLPRLFGRLPQTPMVVRPEPELTRATASDHYQLTQQDGRRLGVFFAVITDPSDYEQSFTTPLFLHEGLPGHHLQAALHDEMPLPAFRKHQWINAYGEGWALYAETLGDELGLYRDDPLARLGQLQMEIMRAARLVVDTGLHALGWTRDQAMAYWRDVVGATEGDAARAIDRYLAWPAQALGYKIGSLRIQQLRAQAEARLGAAFRLADFHDRVLADGPLPLDVLSRRIEAWLASSLNAPSNAR